MATPGYDVYVIDAALGGDAAAATDTLYLLSPNGTATPVRRVRADTGAATLDNQLRAYFAEGGRSVYVQGYGDGTALPNLAAAVAALPEGPGQVVAPEAVTAADHITIANGAWAANKVALLNGPSTATIAQLQTLRTAVTTGATTGARGAALFAGVGVYPGPSPGAANVSVPWPIAVAGMIARSDRVTRNPNLAAAGKRGVSRALGITHTGTGTATLYTPDEISTLFASQINTAKVIRSGEIRNYGFQTLVNMDALPYWDQLSGSRTVMAFRAASAVVDEELVFEQIDGQRVTLNFYEGLLRDVAADLYGRGALYGRTPTDAYDVDTSDAVNLLENIAAGEIVADVRLKTSPHATHVITNIIRRPLTAAEL